MNISTAPMPDFLLPPVVEVALGVQFDPLPGLYAPQMGLLWSRFRDRFGAVEEHPPLPPEIERFGIMPPMTPPMAFPMSVLFGNTPGTRCWFKNSAGTQLLQVQRDRFIHNWRKNGTQEAYPRYEQLRREFAEELQAFVAFVQAERLGILTPNQCEITYVNHIVPGGIWESHSELSKVLAVFCDARPDTFLGQPENSSVSMRFVIQNAKNQPIGRLHISVDPVYRSEDQMPMWQMTLVARGGPQTADVTGVLDFLDMGREQIVRGFASLTTQAMHDSWRRQDVRND